MTELSTRKISRPMPREFAVDDVINVQNYLKRLDNESKIEKADFVPNTTGLYESLTELRSEEIGEEPPADEHSFDKSVNTLLSVWGVQNNMPGPAPATLTETINLFTKNTKLNDESPIEFQGGAENASGRFVHVITGRVMGKHRKPETQRYYLNPRADKMGQVVEELMGAALQADVPLYFKFTNLATGRPSKRTLERTDRVVIFASEGQTVFIEDLLSQITAKSPEAFTGRKIAGFGEVLTDGVTKSDGITAKQVEKFKGRSEGASFNELRARLIYDATIAVTRDLISLPETASVKIGGQTIREKFVSKMRKEINRPNPGTVTIKENGPELDQAIGLGLTPEKLLSSGKFSTGDTWVIDSAISKVARDVIPRIQPASLLLGYHHYIRQLAPKYGIDPNNLARNITMED
jgi:hypothetical protein